MINLFPLAHRVQRRRGSKVRQKADLQQLEQEALVLDAVNSVQEEHHGGFVVRAERGGHVGLGHCAVWRLNTNKEEKKLVCLARFQTSFWLFWTKDAKWG